MKKIENFKLLNIFFVGIGGISMSGLCKISKFLGAKVQGSDLGFNEETEKLETDGVKIYHKHNASNITPSINLVVFSGAIHSDNPEIQRAKQLGIKVIERSKFLGIIAGLFKHVVAISGTHGKTTTTAMIGEILHSSGLNPTIHIGGESINLKDNTIIGANDLIVLEACEYRESFRYLKPSILVITNIESDHLDYFKNIKNIYRAFYKLSRKSKFLIKAKNNKINHKNSSVINKNYVAKNIKFINFGYTFDVYKDNVYLDTFRLNMMGDYNVQNALFAISSCIKLGVSLDKIKLALANFKGVKRRNEIISFIKKTPVIIDYAHHPTEIKESLKGAFSVYQNPLVIFQPHTYSRTLKLFDEFLNVLKVENIVVFKTYPARENEIIGGRAIDLFEKLDVKNKHYFEDIFKLKNYIAKTTEKENPQAILVLGAGDLAENLRKELNNNSKN